MPVQVQCGLDPLFPIKCVDSQICPNEAGHDDFSGTLLYCRCTNVSRPDGIELEERGEMMSLVSGAAEVATDQKSVSNVFMVLDRTESDCCVPFNVRRKDGQCEQNIEFLDPAIAIHERDCTDVQLILPACVPACLPVSPSPFENSTAREPRRIESHAETLPSRSILQPRLRPSDCY